MEQLWLQQSTFRTDGPPAQPPVDVMRTWSVADVTAFFESKDAVGLATALAANSVQGGGPHGVHGG